MKRKTPFSPSLVQRTFPKKRIQRQRTTTKVPWIGFNEMKLHLYNTFTTTTTTTTTATATTTTTTTRANQLIQNTRSSNKVVGEFLDEIGFYQSITVTEDSPIYQARSKYQDIEVHTSHHYGKILVLDGVTQLTERDADAYNEMMAHMPMMEHMEPKRVLVIGGGDGYVVSEVLKHPSVEHVDHVELDEDVIKVCQTHFSWGKAWDDPRVTLHVTDGAAFARNAPKGYYDVIIQDSSDPFGWDEDGNEFELPSAVLYTKEHLENLYQALSSDGVLNFQTDTYNLPHDLEDAKEWREKLLEIGFESSRYGSLSISSYPTGQFGFLLCKKINGSGPNLAEVERRFDDMVERGLSTTYYQPKFQEG